MLKWSAYPLFLATSLALAGCGGGIPLIGGGSQSQTPEAPEQQQGVGATVRNLALYGGPTVPPSQAPQTNDRDLGCPAVDILEGAAGYRGRGSGEAASTVSYQASIVNTARECIVQGNQMRIRVGVEGRLLLGPNGKAGAYSVPVRIVVKRRRDIVTQRFSQVQVTVPASDTQAEFAYLEENLVVQITENDPGDEYDIYVGLDPSGAQAQRQDRRANRASR